MIKKILLYVLLVVILFCVACQKNEFKNIDSYFSSSNEIQNNKILNDDLFNIKIENAIEIVKSKIMSTHEFYYDCENVSDYNGEIYYVVHVYSLSIPLDEEKTQMTYTYGWYYVNVKTGDAYKAYTALIEDLIPLNKMMEIIQSNNDFNKKEKCIDETVHNIIPNAGEYCIVFLCEREGVEYYIIKAYLSSNNSTTDFLTDKYYAIQKNNLFVYWWDIKNDFFVRVE